MYSTSFLIRKIKRFLKVFSNEKTFFYFFKLKIWKNKKVKHQHICQYIGYKWLFNFLLIVYYIKKFSFFTLFWKSPFRRFQNRSLGKKKIISITLIIKLFYCLNNIDEYFYVMIWYKKILIGNVLRMRNDKFEEIILDL